MCWLPPAAEFVCQWDIRCHQNGPRVKPCIHIDIAPPHSPRGLERTVACRNGVRSSTTEHSEYHRGRHAEAAARAEACREERRLDRAARIHGRPTRVAVPHVAADAR